MAERIRCVALSHASESFGSELTTRRRLRLTGLPHEPGLFCQEYVRRRIGRPSVGWYARVRREDQVRGAVARQRELGQRRDDAAAAAVDAFSP